MAELLKSARDLVRRGLETIAGVEPPETHPGTAAALTGGEAVARIEGSGGATFAAGTTGRGRLATGLGLAAAGERAAVRLAGPELSDTAGLLTAAAEQRLPLVVHWASGPEGHAPLHRASGTGAVVLFAADVQEAADLTLVARRLAEEALLPAVVAQDGPETWHSLQDLLVAEADSVRRLLGAPADTVHPAVRSQELLFGRHRRRTVRWHDPARPLAAGALEGPEVRALAAAGRRAYLDAELTELLERAFEDFARETGRRYQAVTSRHTERAKLLLVALGAAAETAGAVAGALRKDGPAAGVVGLRCLRPFPGDALARILRRAPGVVLLERLEAPLAGEGPLVGEVRAALARYGERVAPPVTSVLVPGTLRAADLAALFRRKVPADVPAGEKVREKVPAQLQTPVVLAEKVPAQLQTPVVLGVSFDGEADRYPKRQVLQDALRAAYPEAGRLGVRALHGGKGPAPDARPPGTTSVALHRVGERGSGLAGEAAAVLHAVLEGPVRSLPDAASTVRGEARTDRLLWAPPGTPRLPDPGPDAPVDAAVWAGPGAPPAELVAHLAPGAALLVPTVGGDQIDWWTALPQPVRDAVTARGVKLYTVDASPDDPPELLLGALLGLLARAGTLDVKPRKLLAARRERLAAQSVPADDIDRRLAALQSGLDRVRPLPAAELQVRRTPPPETDDVPAAVRRAASASTLGARDTVDSLPRFWDQVGVPWRRGGASNLTPDPYLVTGTLPALSGALRDASPSRELLPAFDPAACTGCGACWVSCPHGAVEPVVLGAGALLDHGMSLAKRKGTPADALRMAAGKLAAAVSQELAASPTGGESMGALLDAAFAKTMTRLPLPEERKTAVREAFAAVRDELADLPVARTAPFFEAPEAEEAGSGELFALAIDPSACTGCGVCVAACEPGALASVPDGPVRTRDARRLLRLVEELPEASEGAVERARSHPDAGQSSGVLAGALLPRGSRRVLTAGDGAEPGSGESLAVRQVLGAAAFHRAPVRRKRLAALEALSEELAEAIHEGLSSSLPDRDLDALARGLATFDRPEAELADLTNRIEAVLSPDRASGRVDVARLRRLVEVAREVADLRLRLETSTPFGLVLAGGPAAWGATFPHGAFAVPVTVAPAGAAAAMARGLAEGAAREAVAAARTVRTAGLVLGAVTQAEAAKAAEEVRALAGLSWGDLEDGERGFATPVLVVASEDALAGDLTALLELLETDLPAYVLSLAAIVDGAATSAATRRAGVSPAGTDHLAEATDGGPQARPTVPADGVGAPALTGLVASWALGNTSVAHADALEGAVASAMAQRAPALLRVLAPSPSRDGFPPAELLDRAREAWTEAATDDEEAAVDEAAAERERAEGAERRHADELAALRASYEARLAELQAGSRLALAREIRSRLLQIATRPQPVAPNGAGSAPEEAEAETDAEEARP